MFLMFPSYYCNKTIDGAVSTCLHHTSHLCTFDSYRPLLIWNTQRHWESSLLWPPNEHSSFLFWGNAYSVSIPTSPQFPPKQPNYFYAPFDKNDKYTMNPSTPTCCLTTCMMSDNVMPRHVHWCSHSGTGLELIHTIHETHINRVWFCTNTCIRLLGWRKIIHVRSMDKGDDNKTAQSARFSMGRQTDHLSNDPHCSGTGCPYSYYKTSTGAHKRNPTSISSLRSLWSFKTCVYDHYPLKSCF